MLGDFFSASSSPAKKLRLMFSFQGASLSYSALLVRLALAAGRLMYHINNPLCNNQFLPIDRVFASIADRRGRINNITPSRRDVQRKYTPNGERFLKADIRLVSPRKPNAVARSCGNRPASPKRAACSTTEFPSVEGFPQRIANKNKNC